MQPIRRRFIRLISSRTPFDPDVVVRPILFDPPCKYQDLVHNVFGCDHLGQPATSPQSVDPPVTLWHEKPT